MATTKSPSSKEIDQVITRNLARLSMPGVLTVRPGYEIAGNQWTGRRAIVATVHTKVAAPPRGQTLPQRLEGIPVDVRQASGPQRLRAHDPLSAQLAAEFGTPEQREPEWPYERELPSGALLTAATSATQRRLKLSAQQRPAAAQASGNRANKPQIPYVQAPGISLARFTTEANITLAVSPDSGLATLEAFLNATTRSLVVGMYDFRSATILNSFVTNLANPKTLQLVLDEVQVGGDPDQSDDQTVESLNSALGARASITRALDQSDSHAARWMFPSAYHIKVIVRDGAAVWLSSGNLNNTNEPVLSSPPSTEDRDWHVIVESAQLASLFTAVLNQDYKSAAANQVSGAAVAAAAADARTVREAHAKLALDSDPPIPSSPRSPSGLKPSQMFSNAALAITPLLTPDTIAQTTQGQYLSEVGQLIASATSSLDIQMQYIEASSGTGPYNALLQAIADRVTAGVKVRLIVNAQYGPKWAEKMLDQGVNLTANLSFQPNVHNKGIIVDGGKVVVSSQNFSPEGVQQNRDAGLILENADLANYFESVFEDDWSIAKPFDPNASSGASKSGKPSRPTRPTKTSKSAKTTKATKAGQAAKSTKAPKATKSAKATKPGKTVPRKVAGRGKR